MTDLLLLLLAFMGVAFGSPAVIEFDCSNRQGVIWWGCGAYGMCQSGQYSQIDCVNGTVYDRENERCADAAFGNIPYPCGKPAPDCSLYQQSPGHRIPDFDVDTFENRPPCSYYYTCFYGRFLGFQACPVGQVYDEMEQNCNLPTSVPPPCGTGEISSRSGMNNHYGGHNNNEYGSQIGGPNNNQYGNQNTNLRGGQNQIGPNNNQYENQNTNLRGGQNQIGPNNNQYGNQNTNQGGGQNGNQSGPNNLRGSQTNNQYGGQTNQGGGQNGNQYGGQPNDQRGGQAGNQFEGQNQYGGQNQNQIQFPSEIREQQNPNSDRGQNQYGGLNNQYGGQSTMNNNQNPGERQSVQRLDNNDPWVDNPTSNTNNECMCSPPDPETAEQGRWKRSSDVKPADPED